MSAGRYAPSPSGDLHLGNLRTAMLAWLFAASTGRELLLRYEDLDTSRTVSGSAQRQLQDLTDLGITFQGEVLWQSQRQHIYDDAVAQLRAQGLVYECFCTRREIQEAPRAPHEPPGSYPGTCRDLTDAQRAVRRETRPPALRLRTPLRDQDLPGSADSAAVPAPRAGEQPDTRSLGATWLRDQAPPALGRAVRGKQPSDGQGFAQEPALPTEHARPSETAHQNETAGELRLVHPVVTVRDQLLGQLTATVDDLVLVRNDGAAAYNLAVVVDDHLSGVDQVVRGDDLASSAPRQAYLRGLLYGQEAAAAVRYAHVPLVLGPSGRRLAKRDGAVTLDELRAQGVSAADLRAQGLSEGARSQDLSAGGDFRAQDFSRGVCAEQLRDQLLESLGLPAGPLAQAAKVFTPADLPTEPWTYQPHGRG